MPAVDHVTHLNQQRRAAGLGITIVDQAGMHKYSPEPIEIAMNVTDYKTEDELEPPRVSCPLQARAHFACPRGVLVETITRRSEVVSASPKTAITIHSAKSIMNAAIV
jgi:hypothetical protein